MNEASAMLIAHSGAEKVSRDELALISLPPRTHSFKPVAHAHLIDLIENRLNQCEYNIKSAEFAVQKGKLDGVVWAGAKLFATFVLQNNIHTDFAFALGLRAANDKSMAIELVAGCRVFVCDNLALSGDAEILWRKHTTWLNPEQAVSIGVDNAILRFAGIENGVARLKEISISDIEAKATIYDAVVKGVIPQKFLPAVGQNYFKPPHVEFKPRTMWSLHNSFTEVFRTEYATKPHLALEAAQNLGTLFNI